MFSMTAAVAPGATWREAFEVLTFRGGYNTNVVIAGTTLLGLAAGVIGTFALLRKRSLVTDALAHATLPGVALAFLAAAALGMQGRSLPVLLVGAAATATLAVLAIQAILRFTRLHEDAAIGVVLSVGFGAGVVALTYIQKNPPAGSSPAGLNTFIYGQTAAMSVGDATLMGAIALAAVAATLLFLKEFALVCFNDDFARVDGWPVSLIDLAMMALVVAVTVAGLQAVGMILVVAMLIVPAVSARFWTERLWLLVVLAGVIGAASGYLGSSVSALLPRKPAGAVIVLTAGAVFALSMFLAPSRGVLATTARRLRVRLRIAGEHVLEAAYERQAQAGRASASGETPGGVFASVAQERGWPWWFKPLVGAWLRARGFAKRRPSGEVELAPAALERGARVSRNHALWKQYLISYADLAPSHVDWSVDRVEHILSPRLVAELEAALAKRGVVIPDPHETSTGRGRAPGAHPHDEAPDASGGAR